jgi:hypothetical protein
MVTFYTVKSIVDKTSLPAKQGAVIDPAHDIYRNIYRALASPVMYG